MEKRNNVMDLNLFNSLIVSTLNKLNKLKTE